ncbi:hypothetical protein DRP53_06645 [candidate division WOR-3 bacterium]|uniref:Bacterial transcriptional activator domain-containing protein n=1 Tax=candidate division WOR-3 bacterium TaxID=2052148 RepID=A0A660SGL8_UNCW3|nr:MAG: hypothetical protein DRP53_06645 [candidate division WOR-3 bacterium]
MKRRIKRLDREIERMVVNMKERNPTLTIDQAQKTLLSKGIRISTGGVWNIWKRYNLTGMRGKRKGPFSKERESMLRVATERWKAGDIRGAARILNSSPQCWDNELVEEIPDHLLSLPLRVEKLIRSFWKLGYSELCRKARDIRLEAETLGLFYYALCAGAIEILALDWCGAHEEQLALARRLSKLLGRVKGRNSFDPARRFEISIGEAQALAKLGRVSEAIRCIKRCENFCRHPASPDFLGMVAAFYSSIGYHRKARRWIEKNIKLSKDNWYAYEMLAANRAMAGEYDSALKTLRAIPGGKSTVLSLVVKSLCFLGKAKISEALNYAARSISQAERRSIPVHLWSATLTSASCMAFLGKKDEAMRLLMDSSSRFKKFKIKRVSILIDILLNDDYFPKEALLMPDLNLALLLRRASSSLKLSDYRKAFRFAESNRLMGLFHRLIPLFPEPVICLLEKGKRTGLPRAILKLPIFNREVLVYNIRFLGGPIIYRNGKYLRIRLAPKDAAFVIQMALRANEPGKKILLEDLCHNLWHTANNPTRNLSHLLMRIKRMLRIPTHLLEVSRYGGESVLINRGLHFITDFGEFEQLLVRAYAFERVGEWDFAKREFLRAFRLFRSVPLEQMYDRWSDELQRAIMNRLEREVAHFVRLCLQHKNKRDAGKALKKVGRIIPYSREIEELRREVK